MPLSLEELFAAFQDSADPEVLGQVYDRAAPRLLRAAVHLSASSGAAEDLLQATFVAAIEQRDRYERDRPLMPWLLGIMTNQARLRRARERRRPDPSRLPAAGTRDPAEAAAGLEFSEAVDDAIAKLPAWQQPVLVLHLRHGLAPVDIAHALRRSPNTVRSQLARGLRRLRQSLPTALGTALTSGVLTERGLAAVRTAILTHASAGATLTTAGATTVSTLLIGTLLMKKVVLAITAIGVSAAVWILASPTPSPPIGNDPAGAIAPPRVQEPAATESPRPTPRPTAGHQDRVALPETARAAAGDAENATPVLRGLVRWSDGAAAAGVLVRCERIASDAMEEYTPTATSDAEGRFEFPPVPAGSYRLVADRGAQRVATVADTPLEPVVLTLARGCEVIGEVRNPDGAPVANARIWLSVRYQTEDGAVIARTDASGRFVARDVPNKHYIGARAAGHRPSPLHFVDAEPGTQRSYELIVQPGAASVTGAVLDHTGQPVANAIVRGAPAGAPPWRQSSAGISVGWAPVRTHSDGRGAFELGDLGTGVVVIQVRAPGYATFRQELTLAAGARAHLTAQLVAPASITGRVTDPDGAALSGLWMRTGRSWTQFDRTMAMTDENGEFTLRDVTPGEVVAAVTRDGYVVAETTLQLVAGQTARWDPRVVPRPRVLGRVIDTARRPLSGWTATLIADNRFVGRAVTDEDGLFAIASNEGRRHRLRIGPGELGKGVTVVEEDDIETSTSVRDFVVPLDRLPTSTLRGRIVGPSGTPVGEALVLVGGHDRRGVVNLRTDADGRFAAKQISAGQYWVSVQPDDLPWHRIATVSVAPTSTLDLGDIELGLGGRVEGTVAAADQSPIPDLRLSVADPNGVAQGNVVVDGSHFRSSVLAPGEYTLLVQGPGIARARHPFAIHTDQTTKLTITPTPGVECTVRAQLPDASATPQWVAMTVFREREVMGGGILQRLPDGVYEIDAWLAPGTYRVMVGTDGQAFSGSGDLTVRAGHPAVVEIVLRAGR